MLYLTSFLTTCVVLCLATASTLATSPVDNDPNTGIDQEATDVHIVDIYIHTNHPQEEKGESPEGTYVNTSRV